MSPPLADATMLRPCRPLARHVTHERDRGWPGIGPPWRWLCSDIERDQPRRQPTATQDQP